jgi:hypothetical protein
LLDGNSEPLDDDQGIDAIDDADLDDGGFDLDDGSDR